MGSLLACYALTGDVMFRDKAAQLGERMLPAFQTETGIPHSVINLHTGVSLGFRGFTSAPRQRQRVLMLIISDVTAARAPRRLDIRGKGRGWGSFRLPIRGGCSKEIPWHGAASCCGGIKRDPLKMV